MKYFSFIDTISFLRIRVTFEALTPLTLPTYKGSAFRGCLGETLRNEACTHRGLKCEKCKERYDCSFSQLFNSFVSPEHPHQRKYPKSPHPYIIDPTLSDQNQTDFDSGETFGFDLTIIGKAVEHLSILLHALEKMGNTGIGKNRKKFKPISMQTLSADLEYEPLIYFEQPKSISLSNLPVNIVNNHIKIIFENPLRLKENGKLLLSPPQFDLFIDRLVLRIGLLSHFYCGSPWVEPYVVSLNQIPNINIGETHLQETDWRRYSGTQDRTMNFDGLIGQIIYEGEGLNDWIPLITMGSWLHVGSTATFGLGKYSIAID